MQSLITSKYQITIPKAVREKLKLSVHDALEWKIEDEKIVVYPVQQRFLQHKNSVKVGPGEIRDDIEAARAQIAEKYR
jgi:AbrB family looped-hinge helix DNA binding protein